MKKHFQYARYIFRHKWFVFVECAKRGLWWRGFMHDMSKLLPSEWLPYANFFYGPKKEDARVLILERFLKEADAIKNDMVDILFPSLDKEVFAICLELKDARILANTVLAKVKANPKAGIRDSTGYYKPTDTGDKDFDFAWLLHQKRNRHHWQWWILPEDDGGVKILPMPEPYRTEMICDWLGAGRALGTPSVNAWYKKNGSKMQLHPDTRAWVEMQLKELP